MYRRGQDVGDAIAGRRLEESFKKELGFFPVGFFLTLVLYFLTMAPFLPLGMTYILCHCMLNVCDLCLLVGFVLYGDTVKRLL